MGRNKRLDIEHSKEVQEILNEYRKGLKVLESVKWIEQLESACTYCSAIITKHYYKNNGNRLNDFSYKLKMRLTGKMPYITRTINLLNTVSATLDKKAQELSEELMSRPRSMGYANDSTEKRISEIMKETKEWMKKNNPDGNK